MPKTGSKTQLAKSTFQSHPNKYRNDEITTFLSLTDQPEWVSDWAWQQYLKHRQLTIEENLTSFHHEIFTWLISDHKYAGLWRTLHRQENAWRTRSGDYPACWGMVSHTSYCVLGMSTHDKISGAERKRSGGRIQKLATALKQELDALRDEYDLLPEQIAGTIAIAAYNFVKSEHSSIRERQAKLNWVDEKARYNEGNLEAAHCSSFVEGTGLTALAESGARWASSKPNVYRPEGVGADTKFFVFGMSRYFYDNYGRPLREVCATLARSMLGIEIDAASVAQLAPLGEISKIN